MAIAARCTIRRAQGTLEHLGMTEAEWNRRRQASRWSLRLWLRYFDDATLRGFKKARATDAPLRLSASSRRAEKGGRAGFPSTTARSSRSFTWSSARSPSPPSQPCSVVKCGFVTGDSSGATVVRRLRELPRYLWAKCAMTGRENAL